MSAFKFVTGAAATWSAVVIFACELSRFVAQGAPPPVIATPFQDRLTSWPPRRRVIALPRQPHQHRRRLNPIRRAEDMPN
jgi:hypothetical protein